MSEDCYMAIIRERNAAEAADILADWCRKKDAAITVLEDRLRAAERVVDALLFMARNFAIQPCQRNPQYPCTETDDCITEYCWPCYARTILREEAKRDADQD